MEPVDFALSNQVMTAPPGREDEILPLPVWTDDKQCVSLWRPTWKERLSILLFGKVWLAVLGGQPPVHIDGLKDFLREEFPESK